jgi:hypothetical protein
MWRLAALYSRLALAAILMLGISGCQRSFSYVVRGIVKSATDGSPIRGVEVTLQADGLTHQTGFPFATEPGGKFRAMFRISDQEFFPEGTLPKWSLILTEEGFHDEEIDISPSQRPTSGGQETQIEVVAYMRTK